MTKIVHGYQRIAPKWSFDLQSACSMTGIPLRRRICLRSSQVLRAALALPVQLIWPFCLVHSFN